MTLAEAYTCRCCQQIRDPNDAPSVTSHGLKDLRDLKLEIHLLFSAE